MNGRSGKYKESGKKNKQNIKDALTAYSTGKGYLNQFKYDKACQ